MAHDDRPDPADPWGLAARLLAEGARSTVDMQQRLWRTMGGMTTAGPNDALARYWRGVTTTTAAYYRELARAMAGQPRADDDGRDRARIELEGAVGTAVAATFTVENSDPDPARVSLVQGPCRSGRRVPFAAPATIIPTRATVPAGEFIEVTVQVELDPDLFTPGRTYVVPLRVEGPSPTAVDVAITVVGAQEPDGPPFHLACPTCERTFERTTDNLRLRPHKTPDGHDCPERSGRRVRPS